MSQPAQELQIVRIPVDKPALAVEFLRKHGNGVMDLIAHFWERLSQTPPLLRQDLHLVAAVRPEPAGESPISSTPASTTPNGGKPTNGGSDRLIDASTYEYMFTRVTGVMLYVPKAYRADVLAPTPAAAEIFAGYILSTGAIASQNADAGKPATPRCAIDFLTGGADGIDAMIPLLLPAVSTKKAPARTLVNIMMHLPPEIAAALDPVVRPAGVGDLPALNRWRRLYKEERGILFDADMDAWVESQKVFVADHEGQIAAAAKFDLELATLIEIGGVYTFPEFRNHGFAQRVMNDLAARIRAMGKTPTLQVDETNAAAADLYRKMGWKSLGRLGRVWLTDG